MSDWYEREMTLLEDEYERGHLSAAEFREAVRDLNAELQAQADEASQDAYNDVMYRA